MSSTTMSSTTMWYVTTDAGGGRSVSLNGRRAQAVRNDELILTAARRVFAADPAAPISAVAERAGVGISAVYRRCTSKEDLLRRLCLDAVRAYNAEAEAALADAGEAWGVFRRFVRRVVAADLYALTLGLAGTFPSDDELRREALRAEELSTRLFVRARAAGAVRPDVALEDLALMLEQVAALRLPDERRTRQLRQRCLALSLDALRATPSTPLPGPPPARAEIAPRAIG
jgi:AcrR family transcriptional regulator